MSAREDILGRVRDALGRTAGAPAAAPAYANSTLVPARAQGTPAELVARFVDMALEASATVARVDDGSDVPTAVAAFLAEQGLPRDLAMAPDPALESLPWQGTGLAVRTGPAAAGDAVSVTPAIAGIAETGSLLVRSGPTSPYTLNFLPDTHIAVLHASDIVGGYEDGWRRVRPQGETGPALPRTVTLITGPSRSSDIERTVTIGVHGPRRVHIVLVGKADGEGRADGEAA